MQNYPARYEELNQLMSKMGQAIPGTMKGFGAMHHASIVEGALSAKPKSLLSWELPLRFAVMAVLPFTYTTH
jgi:hypothetical protein